MYAFMPSIYVTFRELGMHLHLFLEQQDSCLSIPYHCALLVTVEFGLCYQQTLEVSFNLKLTIFRRFVS
jgi:hypothetical protein